eukprot:NODE_3930_length_621_cov_293.977273_g2830_i0.p1 GENE.NODE_3930_length_621_cov_293.977273_g2830_i0~~NODE_3930_length_621_cov_293.977273_g2830_i0.p1  ORF type:complete len:108 (+),score=34.84 NODE_3930_length_621_cov_293.977273_g2830_i0:22-324(+)
MGVATASNDATLRFWDLDSGECVKTNSVPGGRMTGLAVVPPTTAGDGPSSRAGGSGRNDADMFISFLCGLVQAINVDTECCIRPLVDYGEPGDFCIGDDP